VGGRGVGGFASLGVGVRLRVGELGRGVAPLRLSRGGSEASGDGEEDSLRGEEVEVEKMRGRLFGGSGGLGLVSAETACC
jgi:hypothetical protein